MINVTWYNLLAIVVGIIYILFIIWYNIKGSKDPYKNTVGGFLVRGVEFFTIIIPITSLVIIFYLIIGGIYWW